METSGPSSPATNTSSVCDVCRGLFDQSSPRGFLIDQHERLPRRRWPRSMKFGSERYVYTYLHHKTESEIVSSAMRGCGVCQIISASMETRRRGPRARAPPAHTQRAILARSASGAHAEESEGLGEEKLPDKRNSNKLELENHGSEKDISDMDEWEPSKLIDFVKKQKFPFGYNNILFHCQGRVVIQHYFEEQAGLVPNTKIAVSNVYSSCLDRAYTLPHGQFHHFTTPSDPIDPDCEHRPSRDLLSDSHTGLINRWRTICNKEHKSCQRITHEQALPTRIIEILDFVDGKERVRLVETLGRKRGIYVCLSYCWGDSKSQAGQTTRGNLTRQLQDIPAKDLPTTVLDAIRLSAKLGYQYIWVDRLCIIQDDEKDWLVEASRMCEVYSRSALTISVPVCKESSQSFLAERAKGFREQDRFATITYADKTSEKHQRWFTINRLSRENGPWFLEDSLKLFYYNIGSYGENRWSRRCWTFQEWMLSTRVLHIDSMTLWDCFDGYANELNRRNMTSPKLLRDPSRMGKDIPWDAIVEEYSRRDITREEDRLPAMAGLAQRYANTTGNTYLAGLWLEDLPRSLLWVQRPSSVDQPPQGWSASHHKPSWSWSSLSRAVWYDEFRLDDRARRDFTTLASIRSTICQYQPPGSLARVENAWLYIGCRVRAVTERHYREVWAGDERWDTAPEYDYNHGESDGSDVANVYLLLLGCSRLYYGALIARRFKWEGGRSCFRRLGVARIEKSSIGSSLVDGSRWEEQVVRLV